MWLSRGPDWHFESDMKEEDLQKDMAKNETKSRPLSLRRARACSEKQRVASRPKKEEAAGSRLAVWLSWGPDWRFESDMKEDELQKDMAKNEAESGPLSLCRA